MKYDLEARDKTGHRIFPDGRQLWDETCGRCTGRKMTDAWRTFLAIDADTLRKTYDVERLAYVVDTIKREQKLLARKV